MDKSQAITFGRYALVTNAHLSTVYAILKCWPHLTIGVIDIESGRPRPVAREWTTFIEACDKNCLPDRNPFTGVERIRMWQAAVEAYGLIDRVDFTIIPRPEYNPVGFNQHFPAERYDLVFPQSDDETNPFDTLRNQTFPRILRREVYFVRPQLTLHSSEIKQRLLAGASWRTFLPSGTYEAFIEMCGPERALSEVAMRQSRT